MAMAFLAFTGLVLWIFYQEQPSIETSAVLFGLPVGIYCCYLLTEAIVVHEVALELQVINETAEACVIA